MHLDLFQLAQITYFLIETNHCSSRPGRCPGKILVKPGVSCIFMRGAWIYIYVISVRRAHVLISLQFVGTRFGNKIKVSVKSSLIEVKRVKQICLFGNQASNLVLDLRSSKEDICQFPSRLGDLTAAPRSTSFHLDPILTGNHYLGSTISM